MTHSTNKHTAKEILIGEVKLRVSFWPDENGGPINSVIVSRTGAASIQSDITADEMRKLAALLMIQADSLDEATAARESLIA